MYPASTSSSSNVLTPSKALESIEPTEAVKEPLIHDIETLSSILGEVVKRENPSVYEVRYHFKCNARFLSRPFCNK